MVYLNSSLFLVNAPAKIEEGAWVQVALQRSKFKFEIWRVTLLNAVDIVWNLIRKRFDL